jgi:membrane protein DedA with SNARE-associated domain
MTFAAFVASYGVLAIFIGAGVEGETVVVSGGLLAHQGLLELFPTMIAAAAGSFVADQAYFWLGRRFRSHPRIQAIIARPAFARAITMFERHQIAFVVGFRFIYGLRTISPIAIGTTSMPAPLFVLLNAMAAILWGTVFTLLGYVCGHGIELIFGKLRSEFHVAVEIGAVIAVALAIIVFMRRRQAH